jgi:antirestriction protein ArdC
VAEVQQQLHLITTKGAQAMTEKLDVYSRVTDKIIAEIERGNLTWLQPWQAGGHKAGPVARPLRRRHSLSWRQCFDAVGGGNREGL